MRLNRLIRPLVACGALAGLGLTIARGTGAGRPDNDLSAEAAGWMQPPALAIGAPGGDRVRDAAATRSTVIPAIGESAPTSVQPVENRWWAMPRLWPKGNDSSSSAQRPQQRARPQTAYQDPSNLGPVPDSRYRGSSGGYVPGDATRVEPPRRNERLIGRQPTPAAVPQKEEIPQAVAPREVARREVPPREVLPRAVAPREPAPRAARPAEQGPLEFTPVRRRGAPEPAAETEHLPQASAPVLAVPPTTVLQPALPVFPERARTQEPTAQVDESNLVPVPAPERTEVGSVDPPALAAPSSPGPQLTVPSAFPEGPTVQRTEPEAAVNPQPERPVLEEPVPAVSANPGPTLFAPSANDPVELQPTPQPVAQQPVGQEPVAQPIAPQQPVPRAIASESIPEFPIAPSRPAPKFEEPADLQPVPRAAPKRVAENPVASKRSVPRVTAPTPPTFDRYADRSNEPTYDPVPEPQPSRSSYGQRYRQTERRTPPAPSRTSENLRKFFPLLPR